MSISTVILPKDKTGNDPNAHIDTPNYMDKLLNGSVVAPVVDIKTAKSSGLLSETEAVSILNTAIEQLKNGDAGAHWESSVIEAGKVLLQSNPPEFYRKRGELKQANKESQITDWTRCVKGIGEGEDTSGKSDELVAMVRELCTLFHDDQETAYATFENKGHYETWPLASEGFSKFVSYKSFSELGYTPSQSAYAATLNTLNGFAIHEGEQHQVYLRCAQTDDGFLIDQTNDDWTALKVTPNGWSITRQPEKKFIRSGTATALVNPVNGDFSKLWKHINVPEEYRTLITAFILESWRPHTPYPIVEFSGEQGSAKSTTHSRIRQISDPNRVPLRTAPKDVQDIFVSAANNHQASFENMSNLSANMQDALCTLATGGGFSTRKLYSDCDESVIEVHRPVIINGISAVATRPDLIDRVIHLDLPRITSYKTQEELQKDFDTDLPGIIGGLLTLFSKTLKILPTVKVDKLPRMSDFVLLGEALHQAQGRKDLFKDVFMGNRTESLRRSLEASPVAMAVQELVHSRGSFSGTIKDLLLVLSRNFHQQGEGWPKSPRGLSEALKRTAPALREIEIEIQFLGHHRDGARISIQ
jgi:hypothetical protein